MNYQGSITGIPSTATYLLHAYEKKKIKEFAYFYYQSAKQEAPNKTNCGCAKLTISYMQHIIIMKITQKQQNQPVFNAKISSTHTDILYFSLYRDLCPIILIQYLDLPLKDYTFCCQRHKFILKNIFFNQSRSKNNWFCASVLTELF